MIKVLLVDDQAILREGIKRILEQDKDIKVVGCAENGKRALILCQQLMPDVVLMDIEMPICDGVEGTRLIKTKFKNIKVVILTVFNDDDRIQSALSNGADGYILKDIDEEKLILAVKGAAAGLGVMHMSTYNNVVKKANCSSKISIIQNEELKTYLSDRDLNIIRLIVDGKSTTEIAQIMHITVGSVRNAVSEILKKLSLKDRTQLGIFAVKNDLV